MLISAMEKIKAYNRLYQMRTYSDDLEYNKMIEEIQNKELVKIETSCAEHAIISLCTAFEAFYKELAQELLSTFPKYFISLECAYSEKVKDMISSESEYSFDEIAKVLKLKNRFNYYEFFNSYEIPFLDKKEKEYIEYLYTLRNNYVHLGSKLSKKSVNKLSNIQKPIKDEMLATESKRLRTIMRKMITKTHLRIINSMSNKVSKK